MAQKMSRSRLYAYHSIGLAPYPSIRSTEGRNSNRGVLVNRPFVELIHSLAGEGKGRPTAAVVVANRLSQIRQAIASEIG